MNVAVWNAHTSSKIQTSQICILLDFFNGQIPLDACALWAAQSEADLELLCICNTRLQIATCHIIVILPK